MEYELDNNKVILNFSEKYCKTEIDVLNSKCFEAVFDSFINYNERRKKNFFKAISYNYSYDDFKKNFFFLLKQLLISSIDEIQTIDYRIDSLIDRKYEIYDFVQDFYDYWTKLQRISVAQVTASLNNIEAMDFVEAQSSFNKLILRLYRTILEKLYGSSFPIYRDLPAGINASLLVSKNKWMSGTSYYSIFANSNSIEQILIKPPFTIYTEKNKRTGIYTEIKTHPLKDLKQTINSSDFFCFQAMVGSCLTYVYFHKKYLAMGISCCNLFEFVPCSKVLNKKPDCIYIMGLDFIKESVFYYDKEEDIYLGVAPCDDSVDYFGYVKKMMLTLYNVKMIKNGSLPLHGACVSVAFSNGETKNVVIIGDSGAGKSETIEALLQIAGNDIVSFSTIFDDMGTLKMVDDEIKAFGTEIGAFVRIDDMPSDYAYRSINKAIFMNPDKPNSRLVIPVNTYSQIMKGYNVDVLLYANNFEENINDCIDVFSSVDIAKKVFITGARKAKGTTQEYGLVKSFFANPFGPVQFEAETRKLIDLFFDKLYAGNTIIGTIYTRLAVNGMEKDGPKLAAQQLLEIMRG